MIQNPYPPAGADRRLFAGDSFAFLVRELEKVDEKILEPQKGARTKKKRFGPSVTLNVMFLRREAVDRLLAE